MYARRVRALAGGAGRAAPMFQATEVGSCSGVSPVLSWICK
jgi:hypothetical protein